MVSKVLHITSNRQQKKHCYPSLWKSVLNELNQRYRWSTRIVRLVIVTAPTSMVASSVTRASRVTSRSSSGFSLLHLSAFHECDSHVLQASINSRLHEDSYTWSSPTNTPTKMANPAEILSTLNRPETKENIENRAQRDEIKLTSKNQFHITINGSGQKWVKPTYFKMEHKHHSDILLKSCSRDKPCSNRTNGNETRTNYSKITANKKSTTSMWPMIIHTQTNNRLYSKSTVMEKGNEEIQNKGTHIGRTWASQAMLTLFHVFSPSPPYQ